MPESKEGSFEPDLGLPASISAKDHRTSSSPAGALQRFVGDKREFLELSLLLWCLSVREAFEGGSHLRRSQT
jgi:hypothetical protein